jgi:hypothetical protein
MFLLLADELADDGIMENFGKSLRTYRSRV